MTVEDAIALIERFLIQGRLNKVQEIVFRQAWEGRSYMEIARASGYDPGYIKDAGAELWQSLSKAFGEKVTKHNVQGVLKRFAQQEREKELSATEPRQQQVAKSANPSAPLTIAQNLPAPDFSRIIGRDRELMHLLDLLSCNSSTYCISIEGIGGMGKTTLALAAAYHSLQLPQHTLIQEPERAQPIQPSFDAVIFASAKQERLTAQGALPRLKPERNLQDVFRAIARTLNRPDILLMDFSEQIEQIQDSLSRQSTLLIIDNLETVEDWRSILAFLYDLPITVKVVLTSRQQSSFASIRLEPLSAPESFRLIEQQAQHKGILLSSGDVQTLYNCTSGVPAAIVYAIGQLAIGYPIKTLSSRLTISIGDYAHFYFRSSMVVLQGTLPHHLLMALALFPDSATGEAIAHVAGNQNIADSTEGLVQLQQLSLVRQQEERYTVLALTREYALTELATHPNFEQAARNRWIEWYLEFVQQHGGKNCKDWNEYGPLEQEWENLQAVIEWCIANDRYANVQQLWQKVNCYTHTQGYRRNRLHVWNVRLNWADWLIQAAEQRQDWSTALTVMLEQAWTLTLLGQPRHLERANALYQKAWELRHHQTASFQVELAIDLAVLQIQLQQFTEAIEWLQQAQQLLDQAEIEEELAQRSRIQIGYYQGEIAFKTGEYLQAQTLFQQVFTQAAALNWQRAMFLAKDWLADIAIQEQHFHEAQHLLEEGLQVATANQDECRIAFCERSLAHLEKARGNGTIAQQWATTAKQRFEGLGMMTEARETAILLQTLA